ncbi:MFS transporter, partial [Burkholderia pseudomallei]|nr:MFS transporter [Burkholderia pseudomallei]
MPADGAGVAPADAVSAAGLRTARGGAIAAAVIGNWLEFFDFTVYGFFAVIIGKLYFPSHDATTSLLLSVATFAAGFFTRPLGSIVLGVYADRRGRKAALNLTILLMALGTGMIALAPTYAQIGVLAPVIVVCARLMQGFSQGGEFGAATSTLVEHGG